MRPGPLRRIIAAIGLVAIVPLAVMTVTGTLSPAEAGTRAGIVFLAVLVLTRLTDLIVSAVAASYERRAVTTRPVEERRAAEAR